MTLSKSQIQDLYAFTRAHFVEHYDLQTELVDHLANDIEDMWMQNPRLSFEEAREKAFKKFGVFGFMEPIEQKAKAMNRRYLKYLWTELKEWFTLPKLMATVLLFLIFYFSFSSSIASYFMLGFYLLIAVWSFYKSIQLNRQFRRRKEISDKKWMLEEMIFKQAGFSRLLLLSQLPTWYNISGKLFSNFYFIIGFSVFTTLFFLWMYISLEIIPQKAEELLNETYPEFSL
ncbi:hypothetical protein ACFQ1Q_04735 [Winogradskyella litorisediminis]|uniref:Uncharacterized protein n=1 Tax=Winogradskyella litorisediminis TaxID=1156618 RepID=A0ABW3N6K6_9FLAO